MSETENEENNRKKNEKRKTIFGTVNIYDGVRMIRELPCTFRFEFFFCLNVLAYQNMIFF